MTDFIPLSGSSSVNDAQPPETRRVRGRLFFALNLLFILGGTLMLILFAPAHAWAVFLEAAFFTSPLTALVFMLTRSFAIKGRDSLYGTLPSRQKLGTGTWGLGLLLLIVGLFFTANVVLDRAPASHQSFAIVTVNKSHRRHTIHDYNYSAAVLLPEPVLSDVLKIKSRLELWVMSLLFGYDLQKAPGIEDARYLDDVAITEQEYAAITPESSQIFLNVHKGYLGFLWYENAHRIDSGASSPSRQITSNQPDERRLRDDLSQRAENLSNAMLVTYRAASVPTDKAMLDHADLALSHLRWEYVYNGLPPQRFEALIQKLADLVASGISGRDAELDWESQVDDAIAANRAR